MGGWRSVGVGGGEAVEEREREGERGGEEGEKKTEGKQREI